MKKLNSSLQLLSLNVETDKHLDRIVRSIHDKKPDVVLLQEVLQKDMPVLEKELNMQGVFTPLNYLHREENIDTLGIAVFTALPILKKYDCYYHGDRASLPSIQIGEPEKMARAVLIAEVAKNNISYCFVNTHFTWSSDGKPNARQYEDVERMLALLNEIPELILCGDFNAPRGTAIFDILAAKYKDNIPSEITTTIDKDLHYAGALDLVVDGIFTTPHYTVEAIQIINGLSDHCGLLAEITKTPFQNSKGDLS